MILDSAGILKAQEEFGFIQPFEPEQVRSAAGISHGLGGFGYDIRLSDQFAVLDVPESNTVRVGGSQRISVLEQVTAEEYLLPPHSYVLALSLESLKMPNFMVGLPYGKSTYARLGLMVNMTPIEPGWAGRLTINISNLSDHNIIIPAHEGIAQICFFAGGEVGNAYAGLYQDSYTIQVSSGVMGNGE